MSSSRKLTFFSYFNNLETDFGKFFEQLDLGGSQDQDSDPYFLDPRSEFFLIVQPG